MNSRGQPEHHAKRCQHHNPLQRGAIDQLADASHIQDNPFHRIREKAGHQQCCRHMVIDAKHVGPQAEVNLRRLGSSRIHKSVISHVYPLRDNPLLENVIGAPQLFKAK